MYALDGATSENLTDTGWKTGEGQQHSRKNYIESSRILTIYIPNYRLVFSPLCVFGPLVCISSLCVRQSSTYQIMGLVHTFVRSIEHRAAMYLIIVQLLDVYRGS